MQDFQLFLEIGVARDIHLDVADDDHPGPVAAVAGNVLERGAGILRPRAQQHGVDTVAVGGRRHLGSQARIVRLGGDQDPVFARQVQLRLLEVEADDLQPGGAAELQHDLADQAEPDHQNRRPQLLVRLAQPVHGNGAKGHVGGVLVGDALGHRHEQVGRDGGDLGVISVPGAGARDPVADGNAFDSVAYGQHLADQRIAKRLRLGDDVLHRLVGRPQAVVLDLAQDPAHQVGPSQCLADGAFPSQPDDGAVGAGADQRRRGPDQDAVIGHRRLRRVGQENLAGL